MGFIQGLGPGQVGSEALQGGACFQGLPPHNEPL
jgi:hypothetical protein